MSDRSKIEWTDATWNPIRAQTNAPMGTVRSGWHCVKVSPGCANCYAERMNARLGTRRPYKAAPTGGSGMWPPNFESYLDVKALQAPLHWKKPRMIFVCSMTDLFGDWVREEFIDQIFAVMALCPQHTFQILTKRPDRMRKYFEHFEDGDEWHTHLSCEIGRHLWREKRPTEIDRRIVGYICDAHGEEPDDDDLQYFPKGFSDLSDCSAAWPLPNVWLGVSVESEGYKDRIDELRRTPAAVRFVSAEPLLGAIDISAQLSKATRHHVSMSVSGALRNKAFDGLTDSDGEPLSRKEAQAQLELLQASGVKLVSTGGCEGFSDQTGCPGHPLPGLDWVIVGGESGPGARPMHPDWARGLRYQCASAGVPFFFKQWGEWVPTDDRPWGEEAAGVKDTTRHCWVSNGESPSLSHHQRMARVGKKRSGRLLDGVEHNGMPEAQAVRA